MTDTMIMMDLITQSLPRNMSLLELLNLIFERLGLLDGGFRLIQKMSHQIRNMKKLKLCLGVVGWHAAVVDLVDGFLG